MGSIKILLLQPASTLTSNKASALSARAAAKPSAAQNTHATPRRTSRWQWWSHTDIKIIIIINLFMVFKQEITWSLSLWWSGGIKFRRGKHRRFFFFNKTKIFPIYAETLEVRRKINYVRAINILHVLWPLFCVSKRSTSRTTNSVCLILWQPFKPLPCEGR